MKYIQYEKFWYKIIIDDDFIYWRISESKDDSCCNIWTFNAIMWSLEEAIKKIKKDNDMEQAIIPIIEAFGIINVINALETKNK